MATPYSDIFEVFSSKISDFTFVDNQVLMEQLLELYLKNSASKFTKCKQDLSNRDDINKVFNIDLTDLEIQILAHQMILEWLNPKLYTADLLKQTLSSKDYRMYSNANLIKEIRELYEYTSQEVDRLNIDYTYLDNNLEDLT